MSGLVLGFDYGHKRIGVATGQALTGTATPLATLPNPQAAGWADVDALLAQWRPTQLVVGLPLAADGTERAGTPVALVDERLSSHEAEARLLADGRRHEAVRRERDAMAAAIIVETWLAEQHH